ncbi:MAG: hypothetical protein EXS35_08875 [Pedosphaera sp.]|nr:hypothetical protein [Pedosphaera sp.]
MKTKLSLLLSLAALSLPAQTPVNEDAPGPAGDAARNAALVARATDASTNATGLPGFPAPPPSRTISRRAPNRADATTAAPTAVPAVPGAAPAGLQPPSVPAPVAAPTPTPEAATTPAPTSKPVEEETVPVGMINFVGAEVNQVMQEYARLIGRSILKSPSVAVGQPIFFKNETPLTKSEVKQAYEALLSLNGIAMVPMGDKFLKALLITEAQTGGGVISTNSAADLPEMGQYVSHVVQLKYIKPSEAVQAISTFSKNPGGILPLESSQILILRDYTENVKRMLEMIERIDITVQSEFVSEVIPIKFAKAEDIASALNSLSSGGGGATTVGQRAPTTGVTTGAGRVGGFGNQPYGSPGGIQGGLGTPGAGVPSSTSSLSSRLDNIIRRAAGPSGSGEFQIIGPNKIVADVRSNSLMIFASKSDMETIKKIINQLDVVLAQVVIETIIMDVSLEHTWNLGVSASQSPKQFTPNFKGVGGYNNSNPFFNFMNAATNIFPGNFTGTLPPGFSYFGKIGDTWDVALQAAVADGTVNVIQRPRVQTSHATPASIFVGSTVPYVSSTYYGGGYGGGPSSSYQQLSVGIGLNVTPFINQDGLVVMKIEETIDEISTYTKVDQNSVPNTTHRTLSAEVAVRDGETILLGGFVRNSETKNKSGVPYLKDLPLLGPLFSSRDSGKKRSELIVLMRPTVLRTPALAAAHVAVEKSHMPGIVAAEADEAKVEAKARKKIGKVDFDKVTPFTDEEKQFYNRPSTPQP